MWDLDDRETYRPFHSFSLSGVRTWGRPDDLDSRELIRKAAGSGFPKEIAQASSWAFRICVRFRDSRKFDVDNIPKLIVDSFSRKQIHADHSSFPGVGLYPDDTVADVSVVEVGAVLTEGAPCTEVEIFARTPAAGPASEQVDGTA